MEASSKIILFIGNHPDDITFISDKIGAISGQPFSLKCVNSLAEGLSLLSQNTYDIVLLDRQLYNGQPIKVDDPLPFVYPRTPFIVLVSPQESESNPYGLSWGAVDYLVKGQTSQDAFERALRYALERKQLERQAHEERKLLLTLIDNLPDTIYVKDRAARKVLLNKCDLRFHGFNLVEEALGKTDLELFPDEIGRLFYEDDMRVLTTGEPILDYEEEMVNFQGSHRWMLTSKLPLLNDENEIIGLVGIGHDITNRKRSEEKVQFQLQRLQSILDAIPVPIYYKDTAGQYMGCNQAFVTYLGKPKDQFLGMPPIALHSPKRAAFFAEKDQDLLANRGTQIIESDIQRADGQIRDIILYKSIFQDPDGKLSGLVGTVLDITEEKRAKGQVQNQLQLLQDILDAIPVPIFYINPDCIYLGCNKAYASFTGKSREQIIGVTPLELYSNTYAEIYDKGIRNLLANPGIQVSEARAQRADGEIRDILYHNATFWNRDGSLGGIVGTQQDITEQRQAVIVLQQRFKDLEAINKFSLSLRHAQSVAELSTKTLKQALKLTHLSDGAVFLRNPNEPIVTKITAAGWLESVFDESVVIGIDLFDDILLHNEPRRLDEISQDSDFRQYSKDVIPAGFSGWEFPIRNIHEIVGFLFLAIPHAIFLTKEQGHLLTIFCDMAGNAIHRMYLTEQLQNSLSVLQNEVIERKKIQALLAEDKELVMNLLMSIDEGVIAINQEGVINLFNRAAEEITCYSAKEFTNQHLSQVFQILDKTSSQTITNFIDRLMRIENRDHPQTVTHELVVRRKTGESAILSIDFSPLLSKGDEVIGYVITFKDITRKKTMETQSILSQKMEAIGQLAAGIAHEINTPIQYVGDNLGYVKRGIEHFNQFITALQEANRASMQSAIAGETLAILFESLLIKEKITHYLNEMPIAIDEAQEGVERVRKIVQAIREFSHPSGKEKRSADINQGILTTITISRNEWKYNAEMETDLDSDLPPVSCEIDEINQVILNMIVNSAQAIKSILPENSGAKGKIRITTRRNGDTVSIMIQDTGGGIPQEIQGRIFEPFFTTKDIGQGTGQGLAIAHNIIVNKHHGHISMSSEVGKGTTFTIELPIEAS